MCDVVCVIAPATVILGVKNVFYITCVCVDFTSFLHYVRHLQFQKEGKSGEYVCGCVCLGCVCVCVWCVCVCGGGSVHL